jgi:hypothetical protein
MKNIYLRHDHSSSFVPGGDEDYSLGEFDIRGDSSPFSIFSRIPES